MVERRHAPSALCRSCDGFGSYLINKTTDMEDSVKCLDCGGTGRQANEEEPMANEMCRMCEADETGNRMVNQSEDIPLCGRHWSRWVATYVWPSELEPPCSAHVIQDIE